MTLSDLEKRDARGDFTVYFLINSDQIRNHNLCEGGTCFKMSATAIPNGRLTYLGYAFSRKLAISQPK